ncbi:Rcs stress response system protein RcsF [Gallaecimonas sp. GXIMD1310]|uniref:Rcs stress response system protein RcsF n=1 Tax=Gallaecimonas sp. GXIMD1310 TaxID=3131926 RepID=UPI0032486DF7
MRAAVLLPLLLTGCASQYAVHTNLDKENFSHYFAPSGVKLVTADSLAGQSYQVLAMVSGDSCQQQPNLPPANASDARTDARRKAAKLGANALLVRQCLTLSGDDAAPGCITQVVCQGQALRIQAEK